uniref:Uncharacterized protein n=1 Tax=Anguilla anguilla TaxID=7936 RepID=A0A0E9UGE2_ANGAN
MRHLADALTESELHSSVYNPSIQLDIH